MSDAKGSKWDDKEAWLGELKAIEDEVQQIHNKAYSAGDRMAEAGVVLEPMVVAVAALQDTVASLSHIQRKVAEAGSIEEFILSIKAGTEERFTELTELPELESAPKPSKWVN